MATPSVTRGCQRLARSGHASCARVFLQVVSRRCFHSTPPPVLDFLLPAIPSKALRVGLAKKPVSSNQLSITRRFTSSSIRRHTRAILNPKKDDDGKDMNVEITPRASNVRSKYPTYGAHYLQECQRLKEIMSQDSNPNLALRIQVESGGCHGFQYLMSLATLPPLDSTSDSIAEFSSPALHKNSSDSIDLPSSAPASSPFVGKGDSKAGKLDEDDTVFAAEDGSGAKVVMDGPSLELLKGSKIDFTMELIGSQFRIVDNPLATSSCGCGSSFDIKV
jgi:Fe-S cluster assembly iron-binding protein IscA